jgi:hypothetical protein
MRSPSHSPRELAKSLLVFVAAVVAFVSLLCLPLSITDDQLEPAWQTILAHNFKHRLKAGTDFIFSYGSFGYFFTQLYDPDLLGLKILWEVVTKGLVIVLLLRLFRRYQMGRAWTILSLLIVAAFSNLATGGVTQDAIHAFLIFSAACYLILIGEDDVPFSLATVAIISAVSLTKLTYFVVFSAALVVIAVYALSHRRYRALLPVGGFFVSFLLVLLIYGYRPGDIAGLIVGTKEVAAGYPAGMGIVHRGFLPMIGISLFALLLQAITLLSLRRGDRTLLPTYLAIIAVWLLIGAFAWKQGFVRADIHTEITVVYLGLSSVLFPVLVKFFRGVPLHRFPLVLTGLVCGLCFSIIGYQCVSRAAQGMRHLDSAQYTFLQKVAQTGQWQFAPVVYTSRMVFDFAGWRRDLDGQLSASRKVNLLPETRRVVGKSSVDQWPHHQGVLFLNELNYRGRPVIQSYKAYTPYLTEWDARYFLSDDASKYMLFRAETIDYKYAMMEDPRGLEALLLSYRPVLEEKGFLLLERNPTVPTLESLLAPTKQEPRERRKAVWGETITLPDIADGEWLYISVRGRANIKGRIKEMLLSPTKYWMYVSLASGESEKFRLNPRLASEGFLLNPFFGNQDDYRKFWKTSATRRPVSVRFEPESTGGFDKNIEVTLTWGRSPR